MDQYEAMIKLLLEAVKNEDGTAAGNASANTPANAVPVGNISPPHSSDQGGCGGAVWPRPPVEAHEAVEPAGPVCLQRDRNGLRTEGGH